ncbi:uncharacterized protein LOC117644282 isoform X3 [Thrips palmi]|uniref:Uncharacterized protein LOC117644282 isoform X3 n=1 Tax=Thrips palmi TaxID=161013 RepID=A0A6P8ZLV2_THRPL|nr:uncharacterized protein LOC117644282 isoform X3 [Thrips palmi]
MADDMSHSVTVTRTTTTSTTSAILLNTGYFKTYPGLLKLFELLIGAVIIGITAYYSNYAHNYPTSSPEVFLCIVAVTCLVGTGCLLLSCILSISSASILPKTIFEVIFHFVATVLYLAASINFLVEVQRRSRYYGSSNYEAYLAAAILGLINTVLYFLSTALAYRSYKGK